MNSYKIHIKHGTSEFISEGPEEMVREDYRLFLDLLKATPVPVTTHAEQSNGSAAKSPLLTNDPPSRDDLEQILSQDDENIALKYKPPSEFTDADGLLVILYAYKVLKATDQVLSLRLTAAAIRSGLSGTKASRILMDDENKKYVRTGGTRRGAFYSLSSLGVRRAEDIIKKMVNS
jgi:hypothetical protein